MAVQKILLCERQGRFQLKTSMKNLSKNNQKGFSLVEMIVSLGIFAIVSVVALGAFIKIIDSNKKAQSLKTAINNLNFTLESMSREMRVGTQYYCSDNPNADPNTGATTNITQACGAGKIVAFRSSVSGGSCALIYAYKLESGKIRKAQQTSCGGSLVYDDITAKDLNISDAIFSVTVPAGGQPYAQLFIKGTSGARARIQTDFAVQTTISPRLMSN